MELTPRNLTAKENALFDALENMPNDRTFLNRLYRDGVPTPKAYLAQPVRVLFVFREPNMRGVPYALDMRDEVHDERFRPIGQDGTRQDRSPKSWWNGKAGMFAHAVAAALDGEPARTSFDRFAQGGWNHEVVNRYAYIQVKKLGGAGSSNAAEICAHAAKYANTLKQQVEIYRPHLILGCGVGRDSPARLIAAHVLGDGRERVASKTGAIWWEFSAAARPRAMVQLWHPARRGSRWNLYEDVWSSVRDVASKEGLCRGR
jgi:hypothetical protein